MLIREILFSKKTGAPDAYISPEGTGIIKWKIQNTVDSDVFIVATGLILMMKIWSYITKVILPSNLTPVMIAVIMSQYQTIRNIQMLIQVYEC